MSDHILYKDQHVPEDKKESNAINEKKIVELQTSLDKLALSTPEERPKRKCPNHSSKYVKNG